MPAVSAFLPPDFDARQPLALIAGQGVYPMLVAAAVRSAGVSLRLIGFEEETPPDLVSSFVPAERRVLKVGQLGAMLAHFTDEEPDQQIQEDLLKLKRLMENGVIDTPPRRVGGLGNAGGMPQE